MMRVLSRLSADYALVVIALEDLAFELFALK
jgi:hypothetical protein